MTTQLFRGRTVDEARALAMSSLGQDAVLLTTKRVPRPGLLRFFGATEVEVAATRPEAPAEPPKAAKPQPRLPFAEAAYAAAAAAELGASGRRDAESVAALRHELRMLRTSVARSPAPSSQVDVAEELAHLRELVERLGESALPRGARLGRWLAERGIEGPVAQLVGKAAKGGDDSEEAFAAALRSALPGIARVAPWPLAGNGKRALMLVGPSGVGKTTTAAKLAARAIEDGKRVTLLCADGSRVGAVEQLRRFAVLTGAHFDIALSAEEIEQAVRGSKSDLVLVDTAGRVPDDGRGASSASPARGDPRATPLDTLLCLPAAVGWSDARRFAKAFGPCTSLVITKLDETLTPGGILHGARAADRPISALCAGQRVPEDIEPASGSRILDALLGERGARAQGRV